MAINVCLTNQRCDFVSRVELLDWLNNLLDTNYTRVEELCTGAAFCQLMYTLYPESINLKKVKFSARWEYEYLLNFQLLQNAFKQMKVTREVPALRLTKGRYQDNFELLQWFQHFFNANYGRHWLPKKSSLPSRKPIKIAVLLPNQQTKPLSSGVINVAVNREMKKSLPSQPQITPLTKKVTQEKIDIVKQLDVLEQQIAELEKEKTFYYNKLLKIEKLCSAENEDSFVRIKEINQILYAVQVRRRKGFVVPGTIETEEPETKSPPQIEGHS